MATLVPGTLVTLQPLVFQELTYAPLAGSSLVVAVHPSALRAPLSSHTQLVAIDEGIGWAGALGEDLLLKEGGTMESPRPHLAGALLKGEQLWGVVWPGALLRPGVGRLSSIYDGARPWIVIGEARGRQLLAVPLNEPTNPRWYTPVIKRPNLLFESSKDSQVELAHLWSLPSDTEQIGAVAESGRASLDTAIRKYFGV